MSATAGLNSSGLVFGSYSDYYFGLFLVTTFDKQKYRGVGFEGKKKKTLPATGEEKKKWSFLSFHGWRPPFIDLFVPALRTTQPPSNGCSCHIVGSGREGTDCI